MNKIISNVNWAISENILRLGISFLLSAYVARYLGSELYGYYSFLIAITFILTSVVKFGLESIIVREVTSEVYESNIILISSLLIRGLVFLFLFVLLLTYLLFNSELNELHYIVVISVLFLSIFDFVTPYFQATFNNKFISKLKAMSLVVSSVCKVVFVINQFDVGYFLLSYLIEYFIYISIGFFVVVKKNGLPIKNKISGELTNKMIKEGLPLCLSSLSIILYMKIDQIMINNMLGSSQLGIYSVAVKLIEALYFLPIVLGNVIMPYLVNAFKISNSEFNNKIKLSLICAFYISSLIGVLLYFLSDTIVMILFGKEYAESIPIIKVYLVNIVFVALGVIAGKWYVITGNSYLTLYRTILALLINVCLNLILIPYFGIAGACYASVVSQLFSSFLFNAFNYKTRCLFFSQLMSPFKLNYLFGFLKLTRNNRSV